MEGSLEGNIDQMLHADEINILIKEGEGLTVEFKERYTPKIDRDIVAFANSKGGLLLLGVDDRGKVVGEKLTNKMKAEINAIARNCDPIIADLFHRMGKVERMGSGIERMRELMRDAGLKEPVFEMDAFFRVTFYRDPRYSLKADRFLKAGKKNGETGEKTGGITGEKTREKIIQALKANPEITMERLAEIIGITSKGIEWQIKRLKEEGFIKRIGPAKGGHWEIVNG